MRYAAFSTSSSISFCGQHGQLLWFCFEFGRPVLRRLQYRLPRQQANSQRVPLSKARFHRGHLGSHLLEPHFLDSTPVITDIRALTGSKGVYQDLARIRLNVEWPADEVFEAIHQRVTGNLHRWRKFPECLRPAQRATNCRERYRSRIRTPSSKVSAP